MNEQPPKRKIIKWIALVVSLTVLALWLASTFWTFAYVQNGARPVFINFRAGLIQISSITSTIPAPWLRSLPRGWRYRRLQWAPDATLSYLLGLGLPGFQRFKTGTILTVPLWIPFSLAITPPLALWYADNRRKKTLRGKIFAPHCPRPLRLTLSLLSFPVLLFAMFWIADQFGAPQSIIVTGFILGTMVFGAYAGSRLLYERLGWRWAKATSATCITCGYNLTGNTSGTCPECGTQIAVS